MFNSFFFQKSFRFWVNMEERNVFAVDTQTHHIVTLYLHCLACWMLNLLVDCFWNVMSHPQKPDFVFRRNGRVHLNRRGRQLLRLRATEVCASAVVMLDTPCSEVVWRVLATHSVRQFPLQFLSRASPCAITFQLDCTYSNCLEGCCWYFRCWLSGRQETNIGYHTYFVRSHIRWDERSTALQDSTLRIERETVVNTFTFKYS